MVRFISRRLLLSLITLWLLTTIVFVIANVLPNDVGRTILGPFAPQESVDALNQKLGTDRPLIVQYLDQLRSVATFDYGNSYVTDQPVLPQPSSRRSPVFCHRLRGPSRSSVALHGGK